MFKNMSNEGTVEMLENEGQVKKDSKQSSIFLGVLSKQYIILYVVSFMLSMVGLNAEFSIFSVSMLGACLSSSVPILGIVLLSLIGSAIRFGVGGALGYLLTALVLVAIVFIIKPRYNEQERNEKIKIGKNIFIATFIVQIVKVALTGFTIYDTLLCITISILSLVFYKIFVNGIIALQSFGQKRAFSIEEVIAASLILAISFGALAGVNILGFSITNILSILIVMVLGWKNGILIGTTSGVTIGITLGTITGAEPIMIAAYAISGMLAGILNRFGRIGVIIGFALGNVLLAYISNGYTSELIYFKEILIASLGLLAVPKSFYIEIEEFMKSSNLLPIAPNRTLNKTKEMVENLNNVSQAIQEMATAYRASEPATFESNYEKNTNKQIFITELLNNLDPYKDNMLYEDVANIDGKIIDGIFDFLLDNQEIDRKNLISIFADANSYIVGIEDNNISERLQDDINEIIRTINLSYKISKANFVWRKKVEENNKNMKKQLDGVSKVIENMAKEIENDMEQEGLYEKQKQEILELLKTKSISIQDISIQKDGRFIVEIYILENLEPEKIKVIESLLTKVLKEKIVFNEDASIGQKLSFISDDKYIMAMGTAQTTKSKSKASGDTMLSIRLKDGKYLIAISDGMGSGIKAQKSSQKAIRLLENLLVSGFDKKTSLELINTALINQENEIFATLDIAIIDLYMGSIEFIKSGACPTYIKNKKKVQLIKSSSLPLGTVSEKTDAEIETFEKDIEPNDILLMCSDGILDSNIEYKNKDLWLKYILEDIETTNTKKIADLVINEAIDNNFGVPKDDMSIIVCKFRSK